MSAKTTLIPKTTFSNFPQMQPLLKLLIEHQKITKSQYGAIVSVCSGAYPCTIEIAQRTPKELIYVTVNDVNYTISNRALTLLKP
jgi:hypothetical protein